MNLAELVCRAAERAPARSALVLADGTSRDWAETQDRISRRASVLQDLGVGAGDRVALLALNSEDYLETMYAALWAGAVIVPMNTRWSLAENIYCLNDCRAKILVTSSACSGQADLLVAGSPSVVSHLQLQGGQADEDFERLLARAEPAQLVDAAGCDLAGIFYTGGTTGFPKGVMLSHASLLSSSISFWLTMPELPNDARYLHVAPMFHLADASQTIGVTLQAGTHLFVSAFDPLQIVDLLFAKQVTDLLLVPVMLDPILDAAEGRPEVFASLKRLIYGGSPISPGTLQRLIKAAPHLDLAQGYGQTEMAPTITVLTPADHRRGTDDDNVRASAGRPAFGIDVRVVGEDFIPLPRGEVGQVIARGANAMLGYWERKDQTADTLINGWVATGDAGYFDSDGYLFLVDRYKDMIVTGGENVFSVEVERALGLHPMVRMAAVIGVPHDQWGEAVHAFVIPEAGTAPTADELIAHCKSLIAGYKAPKSLEVVTDLPVSAAGKIQKNQLRKTYAMPDRHMN